MSSTPHLSNQLSDQLFDKQKKFKLSTALITGASAGIGEALALEFATHRLKLILVGRDAAALAKVAEACRQRGSPEVITLLCDLASSENIYTLHRDISERQLTVDILVNNAGYGIHGRFETTNAANELTLVRLQIETLLILTKLYLPKMVERGAGKILNVSSVYAYTPVPFQSVYAAVKAFMLSFSESLAIELRHSGVSVTVVCPGSTESKFRTRLGHGAHNKGMPAARVAAESYRGMMHGRLVVVPGAFNQIFILAMNWLPYPLRSWLIRLINEKRKMVPPPSRTSPPSR